MIGATLGALGAWQLGLPKWAITAVVIVCLLPVILMRWKAELPRLGLVITIVSVLLKTQGLLTVEHLAHQTDLRRLNGTRSVTSSSRFAM